MYEYSAVGTVVPKHFGLVKDVCMLCVHVVGSVREIKLTQPHRAGNVKKKNIMMMNWNEICRHLC